MKLIALCTFGFVIGFAVRTIIDALCDIFSDCNDQELEAALKDMGIDIGDHY